MSNPLEGLRVVELATAIQGPAAGLYFANMGADVVKVEPPMGDPSRYHRGVNNAMPTVPNSSR
jgi:cinnamoyl-CoA:phenyllactate CoA-transferase